MGTIKWMNYLTEFDLYIDIVLIVHNVMYKDFLLAWCEKIVKKKKKKKKKGGDAQGGITNK